MNTDGLTCTREDCPLKLEECTTLDELLTVEGDLNVRAQKLGIGGDLLKQLFDLLGPLMLKWLLSWLEAKESGSNLEELPPLAFSLPGGNLLKGLVGYLIKEHWEELGSWLLGAVSSLKK